MVVILTPIVLMVVGIPGVDLFVWWKNDKHIPQLAVFHGDLHPMGPNRKKSHKKRTNTSM